MTKNRTYTELGGRLARTLAFTRDRVWLGDSHILLVKASLFSEECRRFDLAGIQAITVAESRRDWALDAVLASVATLLGSLAAWAFTWGYFEAQMLGALLLAGALVSAAFFVISILLGPACRTYVRTATGQELLAPLSRWRNAEAVIRGLQPLIQEAQAELANAPQTAQPIHLGEIGPASRPAARLSRRWDAESSIAVEKGYRLAAATLVAGTLLLVADWLLIGVVSDSILALVTTLWVGAALVAHFVALIRRRQHPARLNGGGFIWFTFVYCTMFLYLVFLVDVQGPLDKGATPGSMYGIYRATRDAAGAVMNLAFAACILILLRSWRNERARSIGSAMTAQPAHETPPEDREP